MGKKHGIGWLNVPGFVPQTWNPIVGCSKISEGCANCYAEKMAKRLALIDPMSAYFEVYDLMESAWSGETALAYKAMEKPLGWKKPRAIFVGSMTDLFHENTPEEWIDRVFAVMALCPQHLFIVLTKRADRMEEYMNSKQHRGDASLCRAVDAFPANLGDRHGCLEWPLPNVWLGVTAENQAMADERIPHLLRTPAAVRFVSCEPMVGPVDLTDLVRTDDGPGEHHYSALECDVDVEDDVDFHGATLDWVICGGESGSGARAMNPDWARGLRDQCQAAGVPFFFKQWGAEPWDEFVIPDGYSAERNGGDVLDGWQWQEWPV